MLIRLAGLAALASLPLACTQSTIAPAPSTAAPLDGGYLLIEPHVSVSRNAETAVAERVDQEEPGDVMAEILAIPPGR